MVTNQMINSFHDVAWNNETSKKLAIEITQSFESFGYVRTGNIVVGNMRCAELTKGKYKIVIGMYKDLSGNIRQYYKKSFLFGV